MTSTPSFRDVLAERVMVADGAMGTMLQAHDVTMDDFEDHEGCNEVLNVTRPDIVRAVHDAYFEVGVDCVETNTFGANLAALGEYDISERVFEYSEAGARVARESADHWSTPERPRFVLGSIGPGTKLPTLGHMPYQTLRDSYHDNAAGLIAGGADALIIETCQDLLQVKAAVDRLQAGHRRRRPGRADHRPGDHRDQRRDAARFGDRRGADRDRAARRRRDRPQLRDRPRRDERAPSLPGPARAACACPACPTPGCRC